MEQNREEEAGGLSGMVSDFMQQKSPEEVKGMFRSAGEKMDQGERSGVIRTIMQQLSSKGFDTSSLVGSLGLSSDNPDQMNANDLGEIGGFVREKAPFVFSILADKMPHIAKYFGIDTSGILGKMKGLLGG